MALSENILQKFVDATKNEVPQNGETTVYGLVKKQGDSIFVQIDGSTMLTPASSSVSVKDGNRVKIMIKNHNAVIIGNLSSPSASNDDLNDVSDQITELEIVVADKVSTDELEAEKARIDELVAKNVEITGKLEAAEAKIGDLEADNVVINGKLEAAEADIDYIKANSLTVDVADIRYAKIEDLEATNIKVNNLEANFGSFEDLTTTELTAIKATIQELDAEKISAEEADLKYATIDFANIGTAAIENFFSKSGMIGDLVVGDGTVTGELIGVTIRGDNIIAGTIQADKLVIKGEDGLYYSLNVNGETVEAQQTNQNALDGSHIIAKSIAATKISVKDLVAFDATIGGYNITDEALYSGVKSSIDNTTVGVYLDSTGQINIGDQNNFLKYYKDSSSGQYKLEISADSFVFSSSGENIEDKLDSISSGYSVFMSKENHTFEGDTDSVSETQTVKSLIKAMYGNEVVDCTVEKITTPTGLTIVSDNAKPSPTLTITATTGLTTAGTVIIPITIQNEDGKTIEITKMFSYSIAYKGQNGAQGEPGKPGSDGTGVTIKSTSITYQVGTNGTTPPTGTWLSTIPTVNPGQYLWTRTIVTYSDNKSTTSYSVSRNGTNGATGSPGKDGVSIQSIKEKYAVSTSNTTPPSTWSDTVPTMTTTNKYLWNYEIVTYSDKRTEETTKRVIGVYGNTGNTGAAGPQGPQGPAGEDGKPGAAGNGIKSITNYYLVSSKNTGITVDTAGWTTTPPVTTTTNKYLWNYEAIAYTNGTTTKGTPRIIGTHGATGSNGSPGVSITKTEVFYYLSTSNTTQTGGSWVTTPPAWVDGKYYWQKIKTTFSDGKTSESTPVCITGGKGQNGTNGSPGSPGQSVTSIVAEYYLSTSKTTQTGGSWVTTMPAWSSGKYLWIRNKITYANPAKTEYTTPYCDSSWEAVNDIEVGGRNLLRHGNIGAGSLASISYDKTKKEFTITTKWTEGGYVYFTGPVIKDIVKPGVVVPYGRIVTISMEIFSEKQFTIGVDINNKPSSGSGRTSNDNDETSKRKSASKVIPANTWTQYSISYSNTSDKNTNKLDLIDGSGFGIIDIATVGPSITWKVRKIKAELGTIVTDWTPAPEDVDADIDEATKTATNFLSYDSTNGLLIGNKTGGSWTGYRTQITASAFNILDASGKQLASYGANIIELGKANTSAQIKMVNGAAIIDYSKDVYNNEFYATFRGSKVRLYGDTWAGITANSSVTNRNVLFASQTQVGAIVYYKYGGTSSAEGSSGLLVDAVNGSGSWQLNTSGGKMVASGTMLSTDYGTIILGDKMSKGYMELNSGGSIEVNASSLEVNCYVRTTQLYTQRQLLTGGWHGFYADYSWKDRIGWFGPDNSNSMHLQAEKGNIQFTAYGSLNSNRYWNDTGWAKCTVNSGFSNYNTDGTTPLSVRKINGIVHLSGQLRRHGSITPSSESSVAIGKLPDGYAPRYLENFVCQGSQSKRWLLTIRTDGWMFISRYSSSGTTNEAIPDNTWLNCFATWIYG